MKIHHLQTMNTFKVYFDDILHLSFYLDDLICIQSYHYSGSSFGRHQFFIELSFKYKELPIKIEYDNKKIWEEVLALINKINFINFE